MCVSACSNSGAGLTFDERWTGTVAPQDQAACGPPTTGTLTRRNNAVTFTPNDGTVVISGAVDASGHVAGTLALTGADHHPFPLSLAGTLSHDSFQGSYTTPRCTSLVTLHRPA